MNEKIVRTPKPLTVIYAAVLGLLILIVIISAINGQIRKNRAMRTKDPAVYAEYLLPHARHISARSNGSSIEITYSAGAAASKQDFLEKTRKIVPGMFAKFPEAHQVSLTALIDSKSPAGDGRDNTAFYIAFNRDTSEQLGWGSVPLLNLPTLADSFRERQIE